MNLRPEDLHIENPGFFWKPVTSGAAARTARERGSKARKAPRGAAARAPSRRRTQAPTPDAARGCLITFEGIEGSGKTTHLARLFDRLKQAGWDVVITREPGGTAVGESIRKLLLDSTIPDMNPKAELLLYLASRVQHLHQIILPALRQGKVVLCDRFSDATVAYQGYGRGLDLKQVIALQQFATDGLQPNLMILLDVETHRGLERIGNRTAKDRLEREQEDFYERVRQGYLKLARAKGSRAVVIDANLEMEKVADKLYETVLAFLTKNVVPEHPRT